MSGMPLKKFFFQSHYDNREIPPSHTHVLPWINYRFVHVRNWNTSSLLGILFCLLWQKLQLIQSEQESQTHQYLLMKSSPFINRDLISRHLLIARHVQGTLGNSEPSLSEKLTGPLQWRATATWSSRSWVGSTSGWYRPCSGTWDLHKWPCWRIMMSWCACWTLLPCKKGAGILIWKGGLPWCTAWDMVAETCSGPWFYTNSTTKLLGHLSMSLNLSAAAAAKSLQLCPTLCNPRDGSPPGSPIPGILQARTLEWVAISFSNAWKWKVKVKLLSCVQLLVTPWIAAYQAPLSMGFARQEYWSGLLLPSPLISLAIAFIPYIK